MWIPLMVEEDEIMGLHFSRQLYLALEQVYPPAPSKQQTINETSNSEPQPLNKLQDKLLRKLGSAAHPFTFQLPKNAPPSVTLQPGPEDQGPPLGVEYEVKMFVADNELEKPQRLLVNLHLLSQR
uniref:Arrestin-like N-terminal domain-containing protein n=1 Tax=Tetranychus urticae TaxID=32264 RepID=T1KMY3_TETUR